MMQSKNLKNSSLFTKLWIWVLIGMFLGILFGIITPQYAKHVKPLIDYFIYFVKILVGPIIFLSLLNGIVGIRNLKQVGIIAIKALIYFEIISTLSLVLGLVFGHIFHPGRGLNLNISSLDTSSISQHLPKYQNISSISSVFLNAIPYNPLSAFIHGNTLQIIFMSIITSFILFYTPIVIKNRILNFVHKLQNYCFKTLSFIILFSPIAAFAAMAFMLGQFGTTIIWHMISLVGTMVGACLFFILIVLGFITRLAGFNILQFLNLIKEEIILVFATSSSESALSPLMQKLENSGIEKSLVNLVIPTGYSFNLDGTNIYLSLAIAFLCQAFNIHLSFEEYLTIIFILMISSKGAAGVTGSGFIVLAGTLAAINKIPVITIGVLIGIDKIMSDLRSITNLIGNSVASVIIARIQNKLDINKFEQTISQSISKKKI